jgi:DNA-binding MarR family transcriptional regulator
MMFMTADRQPPTSEPIDRSVPTTSSAHAPVDADETAWALRDVLRGYSAANVALGRNIGLSSNDLSAMEHLLDGGGDLGPVELGHRLGIRSASATAMVDRLEEAGHLQRMAHPTDRRRRVLHVTENATSELMKTLGPLISDLTSVSTDLSDAERETVIRYLKDVATVLWKHANAT